MRFFKRKPAEKALRPADNRGGWWGRVVEPFAGAWQRNVEVRNDTVLAFSAVFSCITLIAGDIGKMRVKLVEQDDNGIWQEADAMEFSRVLKRPNHYQNRIKFFEYWLTSKLVHGNAYALKQRDPDGLVEALYPLDPRLVTPLVSDSGEVFYQLKADHLSGLESEVVVPAREIIHDTMICLFHPLVGVSPIYACGLAAMQGMAIQDQSAQFFANGSKPSGILTAPKSISDETAQRLKEHWDGNYSGKNAGKVAVLGDGLTYEQLSMSAVDSQLVEQLRWSAENVCSAFHVPGYKVGVGPAPTYQNAEILNQIYYSDCLQTLIESCELCLDEGLELPEGMGVEFDLDGLLRMDTATLYKANNDAVGGGWMAPNEARRRANLPPVKGGETPYLQQQNYSLAALDQRDQANPLGTQQEPPEGDVERLATALLEKELSRVEYS
jgi:HK97 family phage portal protein